MPESLRSAYLDGISAVQQGLAASPTYVAVLDADGELLVKVPVDLGGAGHGDGLPTGAQTVGGFELIPWPEGAASVGLRYADLVVATRKVSPNAPEVELLAPTPLASFDRTVEVQWSASDADGDPLSAVVEWSGDAGKTWRPVATGVRDESLTIDDLALPGGSRCWSGYR